MALNDYTPSNTAWPDLDGIASQGPLQLPASGDPLTYDNMILSSVGTNPTGYHKQGVIAKVLDGLQCIKRAMWGGQAPTVPGLTRAQELRITNRAAVSSTLSSNSAWLTPQEGAATVGTTPAVDSKVNGSSGDFFWLALDLPPGATLGASGVAVTIYTIGLSINNAPAHGTTYTILKYGPNSAETALSSATADAHTTGGGGNLLTTVVATNITPTSPFVVDPAFKYALLVTSPWDGGVAPAIEVRGMTYTIS
jgi:hypothetical protein